MGKYDIFTRKTRQDLQSQKSRKNLLNMRGIGLLFLLCFCALFFACSSPESDGKKAGKAMCKCMEKFSNELGRSVDELSDGAKKCVEKIQKKIEKAEKKYGKDKQKEEEWHRAFSTVIRECEEKIRK